MGSLMRSNDKRRLIYKHILEYPGVSFQLLKGLFIMTEGNLRYHLNVLETEKKVRSKLMKRGRCYYPFDMTEMIKFKGVDPSNLSRNQARIITLLRDQGPLTRKEILTSINIERKELTGEIRKLKMNGLVLQEIQNGVKRYLFVTDEVLKRRIFRLLMVKLATRQIDEETFLALEEELLT